MKILYVITKSNWGGAQRYVFDLALDMRERGHDIVVALGGEGLLLTKLSEAGIRTMSLPSLVNEASPKALFMAIYQLSKFFRDENPDIVHLNSSLVGIAGAFAGRYARIPRIVFTAHGWAFKEDRLWFVRDIILVLSWLSIILSHKTIAVSEAMKKEISFLPFIKEKMAVIRNGIRKESLLSKEEALHELSKKIPFLGDSQGILIGTIAELHPIKGLVYLIDALSFLKERGLPFKCIVIGEGKERGALETFIVKKNLKESLILGGFMENASRYLPAFDIFTMTSTFESLNFGVLEAGRARLPVIATKVGGMPEIITDRKTGLLVAPRNPREIADAIQELASNEELRKNLGKALQEKVEKEFDWDETSNKTALLYKA